MEAADSAEESMSVGRFRFRRAAFDWAEARLLGAAACPETRCIVIDEIGPLELAGEGFAPVLRRLLARGSPELVIVVRESLAAEVGEAFGIVAAEAFGDA